MTARRRLSGIHMGIVLVATVPALLLAGILAAYVVSVRLADLETAHDHHGQLLADQLGVVAFHGLAMNDRPALSRLAAQTLAAHENLLALRFTDVHGRLLAERSRLAVDDDDPTLRRAYAAPIRLVTPEDALPVPGVPDADPASNVLGKVELVTANLQLAQAQRKIVNDVALLTLAMLLVAVFAALMVSTPIWRPLARLTTALERIRQGEAGVRVPETSRGELRELEVGFNNMAATLENVSDEMQQQIEQATGDLQQTMDALEVRNIELDLARKRALEASRIKSEFLAKMSHEIRTPMNGVIGFTNLLRQTELDGVQRQFVDTIHASASHLLRIINDILDFSKLENRRVELAREPFELRRCVEEAVALLAPQAHDKGLELVSLVYDDVPDHVVGDATRIGQILNNLLSNAIKFTDHGEVILRTMLEQEDPDGVTVQFSVTDTGVGIAPGEQKQLFTAFQQAAIAGHRLYGGTGLGLSICRHLAHAMGGSIRVESRVGEGSVFEVTVRLAVDPDARPAVSPPYGGRQALLRDSHPKAHAALRNTLEELGFRVLVEPPTDGGEPAVDLVCIGLPGHGAALARFTEWHQTLGRATSAPILALVSGSDQAEFQALREAGAQTVVSKPVSRSTLLQAIRSAFDLARSSRMPPKAVKPAHQTRDGWLAGRTALIADDNAINLGLMQHLLEHYGASVVLARDGVEAVKQQAAHHADLVFLDIHMPHMNGFDAAARIRAQGNFDGCVMIALTADTAYADSESVEHFDDVLIKPIDEEGLRAVIARRLGISARQEGPAATPADSPAAASGALPARDLDKAMRVTGGNAGIAEQLFARLLDDLPGMLAGLHEAFAAEAWDQLAEQAHKARGACGVCATPALEQAVDGLEQQIKARSREGAAQALAELQRQADRLTDRA